MSRERMWEVSDILQVKTKIVPQNFTILGKIA